MKGFMHEVFRQARRGRKWLAAAAIAAAALALTAACDQGFTVASSGAAGESRPTPAVAFTTPRTTPAPKAEPTPTAEIEESAPSETAAPTTAPATEAPTTAPPVETASPIATVERTLVPAVADPTAAADRTATGEAAPTGELSQELQSWLVGIFEDLTAGITAVRPFEYDPGFVVLNESNNLAMIMPTQFLQAAFDSKVSSSYFVRALQIVNVADPAQLRRPTLISELVLVHESEADASLFVTDYRDFAIPLLGTFPDQYIQENFPDAQRSFQEDAGFGLAEEEFILVGEYDLGTLEVDGQPQFYIMIGRQKNVNFALMVLYLDPQSRMRPFALFDRLVSKVG